MAIDIIVFVCSLTRWSQITVRSSKISRRIRLSNSLTNQ